MSQGRPVSLPRPRTVRGTVGLAEIVRHPAAAVVAVDLDGTLAPIVADPATAVLVPGSIAVLGRLAAQARAIAVITGRSVDSALAVSGLGRVAFDVTVFGLHGFERWDPRTRRTRRPEVPPGVAVARDHLAAMVAGGRVPPGTTVEDKVASLAVHVRACADPVAALAALEPALAELARRTGLALEPGRMVRELRPPEADKGKAIRALVAESDARAVLMIGDDVGDLAAFAAIRALADDGVSGLCVCVASPEVSGVAEAADLTVDGPAGVVAFLGDLAQAWEDGG